MGVEDLWCPCVWQHDSPRPAKDEPELAQMQEVARQGRFCPTRTVSAAIHRFVSAGVAEEGVIIYDDESHFHRDLGLGNSWGPNGGAIVASE